MKSRTLMCITAITLFAVLAIPVPLAAQHTRYKLIDIDTLGGPAAIGQVDGTGINRQRPHRRTAASSDRGW